MVGGVPSLLDYLSEADYGFLASTTCELQLLLYLLRRLHVSCAKTPVLYNDNHSALYIAANPVFNEAHSILRLIVTWCVFVRKLKLVLCAGSQFPHNLDLQFSPSSSFCLFVGQARHGRHLPTSAWCRG